MQEVALTIQSTSQIQLRATFERRKDEVRLLRTGVMADIGRILFTWRQTAGVQQQDLASAACLSPTVVRRIEKADYESPPPESLLLAVSLMAGPHLELMALTRKYRHLQSEQRRFEKLLGRKTIPPTSSHGLDQGGSGDMSKTRPDNLPPAPDFVVGRSRQLGVLAELLRDARLTTIVGPGGIGKTTLAVTYAATDESLWTARWFVDFSLLADGADVWPTVVRVVLDADVVVVPDPIITLCQCIGDSRALLVLDNCEHVLSSVAELIHRLTATCSELRILATSRESIRIPEEATLTLAPLSLGTASFAPESEALGLFDHHVRLARSGQSLSPEECLAAYSLCERLDSIPLALELAARATKYMSIANIEASLDAGSGLSSGNRLSPRHETMSAAIRWSWNLLSSDEQLGLARLCTLSTSFRFDCASTICRANINSIDHSVITALIEKSMVVTSATGFDEEPRARVLKPIRDFVIAYAGENHQAEAINRLRLWFADVLPADEMQLQDPIIRRRLLDEADGIMLVLKSDHVRPEFKVEVALAIWLLLSEPRLLGGADVLALAIDPDVPLPDKTRARALGALGQVSKDPKQSFVAAMESVRIRRELGDVQQLRYGLIGLAIKHLDCGNLDQGEHVIGELRSLPEDTDTVTRGDIDALEAWFKVARGRTKDAAQLLERAIAHQATANARLVQAVNTASLAHVRRLDSRPRDAIKIGREALAIATELGATDATLAAAHSLAEAHLSAGEPDAALDVLDEYLELADSLSDDDPLRNSLVFLRAAVASVTNPSAAANYLLANLTSRPPADEKLPYFLSDTCAHIAHYDGSRFAAACFVSWFSQFWTEGGSSLMPPDPTHLQMIESSLSPIDLSKARKVAALWDRDNLCVEADKFLRALARGSVDLSGAQRD
jgi:predicted ATPase/tetratricopeptide (TPR) repeat protein